ncbi:MAG: tetratricopeptide repeat protein [Candidatus Cloacimonetes bacterium]|nr:tetratricopeptide repeat protein [Candidatus Cloacimonadota bacterium]
MKKIIITLLIIFAISSIFANKQIDNINNDAIKEYQNKDFTKALELFLQIENESIVNADLYYNIGNCYFRQNEIGRAILYFKRSLKFDQDHQQAQKNLDYALAMTKDKQLSETDDFITSIWNKTLKILNLNILAIIVLIIFMLIVIMINFIILRYRNREKTIPVFITTLLIFLFAIFVTFSVVQWKRLHNHNFAVLLTSNAAGFSGPSDEFTRVFTIHEGMIFEIDREENEWSLIKLSNGIGGWIRSEYFERI